MAADWDLANLWTLGDKSSVRWLWERYEKFWEVSQISPWFWGKNLKMQRDTESLHEKVLSEPGPGREEDGIKGTQVTEALVSMKESLGNKGSPLGLLAQLL